MITSNDALYAKFLALWRFAEEVKIHMIGTVKSSASEMDQKYLFQHFSSQKWNSLVMNLHKGADTKLVQEMREFLFSHWSSAFTNIPFG